MSGDEATGGSQSVSRIEAFSDGVIAIIVTIMVLEIRPPHDENIKSLFVLWPIFLSYALSFSVVSIYWINHHQLMSFATRKTNGTIWANLIFLFTLSLVPFATTYLGEQKLSRNATLVYLGVISAPAVAYTWLRMDIRKNGSHSVEAKLYHQKSVFKSVIATMIYIVGFPMAYYSPMAGFFCAFVVAMIWLLPKSQIDDLI